MKVCPRCSYVDIEARRVCFACRRSLMGTSERDLVEILEMREAALVGADGEGGKAPWGPGLTALVERALEEGELAPAARMPDGVPVPTRSAGADGELAPRRDANHPVSPPARPPAAPLALEVREGREAVEALEDAESAEPDELRAEITRQQLAKLYDTRLAAPVLLEVDTPANASRPAAIAPASITPRTARPPRSPNRRRAVFALALVVASVVGVRFVQDALRGDDQALVQDPTTPVDRLPWRYVQSGPARVNLPAAPSTAAGSAAQLVTLPDLSVTVNVRPPAPSLTSDLALRTYTIQLASQVGGRFLTGSAIDTTGGTAFTALVEVNGATSTFYVLSAPDAVVEVRGDLTGDDPGRANAILGRIVSSITVG